MQSPLQAEIAASIRLASERLWPELVALQRDLHSRPELGFEEHRTSQAIAAQLEGIGCVLRTGIARTGVLAELPGRKADSSVLFRVDMDAFPLEEASGLPWASKVAGVSHACGHDAHAAIGVGVVRALKQIFHLPGVTIKVFFQPAEERPLCEEEGERPYREGAHATPAASIAIQEGIMEDPPVRAVFGLHLWPWLTVGQVGLAPGAAMAGVANFLVTLHGRSAHAAVPHEGIDTLLAAAHLVTMLQAIVAREIAPEKPLVINVGTIRGGDRRNVIADRVDLTGTVRSTCDELLEQRVPSRMQAMLQGIGQALGVSWELQYCKLLGPVVNDRELTLRTQRALAALLGEHAVVRELPPAMTSEDFACYAQVARAVYLKIGCTTEGTPVVPLHSRNFQFDPKAILMGLQAALAAIWAEAEYLATWGG